MFLSLALTVILTGQTATPQGWDLQQLMHDLGAVRASHARFSEQKFLHILNAPLEDSGTLIYVAPDRVEKNTLQPKPERLIVNGDTLTIEREGKSETFRQDDSPQVWAFIEGIRATLAGDLTVLEHYYHVRLEGGPAAWQLSLEPRDEKMREIIQSIRISGSNVHIKRVETQEKDGDRSDMTIVEDDS